MGVNGPLNSPVPIAAGVGSQPPPKSDEKWDEHNMSHRRAIPRQTRPRQARADTRWQRARSRCVHLDLHSARDLASLPKEKWCHSLGLQSWDKREGCTGPSGPSPHC